MIFISFSSQDPRNYTVTFGTRVNLPYMQHYVQQIFIHENYIRGELHDDIAVILLTEKVLFKESSLIFIMFDLIETDELCEINSLGH